MAEILDSGSRREFSTGAVRDIASGKGRCDLIPLGAAAAIMNDIVLSYKEYILIPIVHGIRIKEV